MNLIAATQAEGGLVFNYGPISKFLKSTHCTNKILKFLDNNFPNISTNFENLLDTFKHKSKELMANITFVLREALNVQGCLQQLLCF